MSEQVSIGQVKRDISELVNRVAYGGKRIVLTSRGRPKAALVSIEDYERLQELDAPQTEKLKAWMQTTKALSDKILERRNGEWIDVETILSADRADLEGRDEWIAGFSTPREKRS
jgi:prevent-host-death family protein